MSTLLTSQCSLCETPLSGHPIVEGDRAYCCAGCMAVSQILEARGALADPKSDPIFQRAVESGVIANPSLLKELQKEPSAEPLERRKLHLEVGEMWCPSCALLIRYSLGRRPGILNLIVDYSTDLAVVEYDPTRTSSTPGQPPRKHNQKFSR